MLVRKFVIPVFVVMAGVGYLAVYDADYCVTGISSALVGLLALFALSLFACATRRTFCLKGTDVLFALFLLVYAFYALVVDGTPFSSQRAIGWMSAGMLYYCMRRLGNRQYVFALLFGLAVVEGIYGMLQWGGVLPSHHFYFPATGSFFNPALLALCLVVGLFAGGYLLSVRRGRVARGVWAVALLALAVGVVLLDSRAAWVGGLAGCGWLLLTVAGWKRFLHYKWLWVVLPVVLLGLAMAFYGMRPASASGRLFIWETAGSALVEHPWRGGGNFAATYMYRQAEAVAGMSWEDPAWLLADNNVFAFNEFLRMGYESGMPGLVLFVALLAVALRGAWRCGGAGRWMGAALCVFAGFACFSYPLSDSLCVAVGVVLLAGCANAGRDCLREGRCARVGQVVVVGLLCAACFCGMQEGTGLWKADRALRQVARGRAGVEDFAVDGAVRRNSDWMLCYGKMLYDRGLYADALPVLEVAVRLCPTAEAVCDLGDCCRQAGRLVEAEAYYQLSARMVPSRITPHSRLLELYQANGDKDAACGEAEYILAMPVKVVNTSVIRARHRARVAVEAFYKTSPMND